uniref:Nodulin-related protein 1 n=1 Tax=Oryza brachyantha TaxID=4533 RepID=J3N1T0_ORYBR
MAEESKSGSGSGDLLSSGKVVAQATMSAFQQKSVEGVDKKEVAGAAADLLHSASTYGKLEDKPVGQYIEQAEGYLKSFSSGGAAKEGSKAPASEGFGLDDVMKGAESLMEKKGGGEESAGSGGGAGGLFKMAQGFMK